jgi:histone-lysine N-methyltransferase SETMAR
MLTVIWGIGGFHAVAMSPARGRFSTEYFFTDLIDPLLAKLFVEGKKSRALRLNVHLNNCRVHSSNALKQFSDENSLVTVPHPPDSPDLAPSNFWLFGQIKTSLAGHAINDVDVLLEAVIEFLNDIRLSELQLVFH